MRRNRNVALCLKIALFVSHPVHPRSFLFSLQYEQIEHVASGLRSISGAGSSRSDLQQFERKQPSRKFLLPQYVYGSVCCCALEHTVFPGLRCCK